MILIKCLKLVLFAKDGLRLNRLVVLGLAFSRSFKGISGSFAVTDFRTEVI